MEPSESKALTKRTNFTMMGLIAGMLLGYPVSYYFQPRALQVKLSLGDYIKHFNDVIGDNSLHSAIFFGFVVAVGVCVAVGIFVDRAQSQKG